MTDDDVETIRQQLAAGLQGQVVPGPDDPGYWALFGALDAIVALGVPIPARNKALQRIGISAVSQLSAQMRSRTETSKALALLNGPPR